MTALYPCALRVIVREMAKQKVKEGSEAIPVQSNTTS